MNTIIKLLLLFIFVLTSKLNAQEEFTNLNCYNNKKSNLLEFRFKNEESDLFSHVYKKVKGNFIIIGEVVGQKSSSFILFEDKYQFLGVDFAWHLDKNTKKLRPVLLSEGTIKLKKMPEEFYCKVF
jgi:lipopolysaccharide assembly outer membrane protein LptD (OstA)